MIYSSNIPLSSSFFNFPSHSPSSPPFPSPSSLDDRGLPDPVLPAQSSVNERRARRGRWGEEDARLGRMYYRSPSPSGFTNGQKTFPFLSGPNGALLPTYHTLNPRPTTTVFQSAARQLRNKYSQKVRSSQRYVLKPIDSLGSLAPRLGL